MLTQLVAVEKLVGEIGRGLLGSSFPSPRLVLPLIRSSVTNIAADKMENATNLTFLVLALKM